MCCHVILNILNDYTTRCLNDLTATTPMIIEYQRIQSLLEFVFDVWNLDSAFRQTGVHVFWYHASHSDHKKLNTV